MALLVLAGLTYCALHPASVPLPAATPVGSALGGIANRVSNAPMNPGHLSSRKITVHTLTFATNGGMSPAI